jgi:hypothetical protein
MVSYAHMHQTCTQTHTHVPLAAEELSGDEVDTIGRRRRLDLRLAVLARVPSDRGNGVSGVPVCVCVCVCVRVFMCVCIRVCVWCRQ